MFIYIQTLRGFKTSDDAFRLSYSIAFVPFAHSQISFIHGCIYSIFPGSPGIWFLGKENFSKCWECWSNASTPNLEDQGISLRLTSHPHPIRQGRPYQWIRYRRHSTRDPRGTQAQSPGTKYLRRGGDTFDWQWNMKVGRRRRTFQNRAIYIFFKLCT